MGVEKVTLDGYQAWRKTLNKTYVKGKELKNVDEFCEKQDCYYCPMNDEEGECARHLWNEKGLNKIGLTNE